jgi:hypothetical protein
MDSLDRLNFFRDRFNIISFIECKKVIELLNKNGCEFSHIVQGDMLGEIKLVFIDENFISVFINIINSNNPSTLIGTLQGTQELIRPASSHVIPCFNKELYEKQLIDNLVPSPSLFSMYLLWNTNSLQNNVKILNDMFKKK